MKFEILNLQGRIQLSLSVSMELQLFMRTAQSIESHVLKSKLLTQPAPVIASLGLSHLP